MIVVDGCAAAGYAKVAHCDISDATAESHSINKVYRLHTSADPFE